MNTRIRTTPRFQADLDQFFDYIAQDKLEPAEQFLVVAKETLELLARYPFSGSRFRTAIKRLAGIRFYPMPSPYRSYLIFYKDSPEGIEALTILHGATNLESSLARAVSD